MVESLTRCLRVGTLLATFVAGAHVDAQSLANAYVRADFDARGLRSLTDLGDRRVHRFGADGFAITIGDQTFESRSLAAPTRRVEHRHVTYSYAAGPYTLVVRYELQPEWRFLSKHLTVTSERVPEFRVRDVTIFRDSLGEPPADAYLPPSARPNLQTGVYGAALRFAASTREPGAPSRTGAHSLLVVAQNPFLQVTRSGPAFTMRYAPEMDWKASYGPFTSDRGLIAPVRLTGRRLPATMVPEWKVSASDESVGLDEGEVAAFTGMVRAFLLYRPDKPINVFVGWCANDYQIDTGTPAGRAEYRRLLDQAAALGAQYVLYAPSNSALSRREESVDDWSWEHVLWLGLGQKIRKDEWDPRREAVPPSVEEMLDYAKGKGLGLLAYVYPVLPFSQNPAWLVPGRNGAPAKAASLGHRALQDWLIDELVAFHGRTGIAGYAFDYTFLTFDGTSRYAQWWGWRRVMEELRRRIPDIVIDGRQAYHLYGPWGWLAGSYPHPTFHDEQPESFAPYPDLHFDRVSANRERYTAYRYRNYEFAPSEIVPGFITHQTSRSNERDEMPFEKTADRGVVLTSYRARDWDYLGWRYSLLSSIAIAGWNNVLNMIPARDSAEWRHFAETDREWLRRWLAWTVENKELLRHTRTILGQPAFGKIDGTSAIVGDRGFIFLFNPDARRLTATLKLDESIGLTAGGHYVLREQYPLWGRRVGKTREGIWTGGDEVTLTLDGGSARVVEIAPAPDIVREPMLFNAPGRATVRNGTLELTDVRGEAGTAATLLVRLPASTAVSRARVNGVDVPVGARHGDALDLPVRFGGTEFHQLQEVVLGDSAFRGGRLTGTFTIPRRVFEQLAERRRAWPIPWTADDYRTTWLAPERLLLYAQFAEPDDRWEVRLSIDGRPVEMRKAYTAVRVVPSTFVGFYADVSLLEPDRPYRFELAIPPIRAGQFRGMFFENVEPEYTTVVSAPR